MILILLDSVKNKEYHKRMSLSTDIIAAYREHPTIYTAAKKCNCTRDVARRVLLSEGLISSPLIEQVRTLRSARLSTSEIAERLHCYPRTVANYTPYQRGCRADYPQRLTPCASANTAQRKEINRK